MDMEASKNQVVDEIYFDISK